MMKTRTCVDYYLEDHDHPLDNVSPHCYVHMNVWLSSLHGIMILCCRRRSCVRSTKKHKASRLRSRGGCNGRANWTTNGVCCCKN